jgi:hypothetical protein
MRAEANLSSLSLSTEGSRSSLPFTLALSLLGASLSLLISGFVWGTNNALFHLPIVASLYNEPQFANDAFIQSLRYYASGFWLVFRGSASWLSPTLLFFAANLLSRFLAFWGFLACARILSISKRKDLLLFTLVLVCIHMIYVYASAGNGGLFINCFTQSEICNGLSLLCLAAAARRRIALALALNGAVFFLNAFIAAWNFVPLALIAVLLVREGSLKLGDLVRRALLGSAFFLALAAPVLANMLANPTFGKPISFSYIHYLGEYWPMHFLFSLVPLKERIKATILLFLAAYLLWKNGSKARVFLLALAGYAAVFVFGIGVPHLTQSTLILNLHLLRVTTFFHLLAALGAAALIIRWLGDSDLYRRRVLAPFGFAILCAPTIYVLFPLIAESERLAFFVTPLRSFVSKQPRLLPVCGLLCACVALSINLRTFYAENRSEMLQVAVYEQLGLWARSTPAETTFLLPTRGFYSKGAAPLPESFNDNSGTFEYVSHRKVWIDLKRGAAVMWFPPYYAQWHERLSEVASLPSLDRKLAYAQLHGIGYVVDNCAAGGSQSPAVRTETLCVYRAATTEAAHSEGLR